MTHGRNGRRHSVRVLSLFAGIGGFDLGLERAGMTVVAQCELDPFCRQVLKKHWPHVKQYDDVRTLSGEQVKREVGPVDVCVGGYPCQPFSTAGKRGGAEDDRHLWPEMRRLVEELRPAWVVGENVAGHITLGLDQVLSDLDTLGYASRTFVIPAVAVNAPHRRDRVWIVANSSSVGLEGPWVSGEPIHQAEAGDWEATDALDALERGDVPVMCREHDGISQRLDRLRALGNAVVPQVVEIIGRAIMEAQREQDS